MFVIIYIESPENQEQKVYWKMFSFLKVAEYHAEYLSINKGWQTAVMKLTPIKEVVNTYSIIQCKPPALDNAVSVNNLHAVYSG